MNGQQGAPNKKSKKSYIKPEIKSEKVETARMANACNGHTSTGGRKAAVPCTILLS